MADYTKGIKIKTYNGRYGEFMSVGINIEEFKSNPINERGYVNFKITKSRNGDWYAVNDSDRPNNIQSSSDNSSTQGNRIENDEFSNINDDDLINGEEIPF